MARVAELRELIRDTVGRSLQSATIYRIHGDRIDVRVGGSAKLLRGLRVVGGTDDLQPGDQVVIRDVDGERVAESMRARSGARATYNIIGGGGGAPMSPHPMSYHTDEVEWHAALAGAQLHRPYVDEGPGIDLVWSGKKAIVGLGGDTILLYDAGGEPAAEFSATGAGLEAALAAAGSGDVVYLPAALTLDRAVVIPAGVSVQGPCTITANGGFGSLITVDGALRHVTVTYTTTSNNGAAVSSTDGPDEIVGVTAKILSSGVDDHIVYGANLSLKSTSRLRDCVFEARAESGSNCQCYGLNLATSGTLNSQPFLISNILGRAEINAGGPVCYGIAVDGTQDQTVLVGCYGYANAAWGGGIGYGIWAGDCTLIGCSGIGYSSGGGSGKSYGMYSKNCSVLGCTAYAGQGGNAYGFYVVGPSGSRIYGGRGIGEGTQGYGAYCIIGTRLSSCDLMGTGTGVDLFVEDGNAATVYACRYTTAGGDGEIEYASGDRWHEVAATDEVQGIVELATDAEVAAATAGVIPTVPQLPLYRQTNDALQADTGGNARGAGAVDLQIERGAATQVAAGDYSSVRGRGVTASGLGAHAEGYVDPDGEVEEFTPAIIASGMGAHAEGYSYGEEGHIEASGDGAHAEGFETTASQLAAHAEGSVTVASATSAHAEGIGSIASSAGSHAEGDGTVASGLYSHASGSKSKASLYAEHAHASGTFDVAGDAQYRRFIIMRLLSSHVDTTWYPIYLANSTTLRLTIPSDTLWNFDVKLVGLTSGAAQRWSYDIRGTVVNDGGTVTLIESVVTDRTESDAAYEARAVGNDTNDSLDIEVRRSGGTSYSIRWVAVVEVVQVSY